MLTLGDKIKEKRIAAGFSVDELAKRIGKNRATVYRYENGEVDIPVSVVGEIALVLDVSPHASCTNSGRSGGYDHPYCEWFRITQPTFCLWVKESTQQSFGCCVFLFAQKQHHL